MKIRVRLKNHGYIDKVMHQGGEILVLDESKFTETWMEKLEVLKEKPKKSILNKFLGR